MTVRLLFPPLPTVNDMALLVHCVAVESLVFSLRFSLCSPTRSAGVRLIFVSYFLNDRLCFGTSDCGSRVIA